MKNKTTNTLPASLKGGGKDSPSENTLSEKTMSFVKGLKDFFNAKQIGKAMGAEPTKEPTKVQSKVESYVKKPKQKMELEQNSNFSKEETKVLGQIYNLLLKQFDDRIKKQELQSNLDEENQQEEQKKEKALEEEIKGKKEEQKKVEKKSKKTDKEGDIITSALSASVFAAGAAEKTAEEEAARPTAVPKLEKPKAEKLPEQPQPAAPKAEAVKKEAPSAAPSAPTAEKVTKPEGGAPIAAKGIQGVIAETLSKLGITKKGQANVLAQVEAESAFKPRSESLKYKPETLLKMFPKYVKDIDDAKQLVAQGEEAIGNRIYGGRMGNAPDEGYKYRGRGFLQHTGKEQYEAIKKYTGIDVVSNPDLLNDPVTAAKAIPWFFLVYKKKKPEQLDNISEVNKAVGFVGGKDKHEARAQIAAKYENQNLGSSGSAPAPTAVAEAPTPQSTQVASKSKENENLKESLEKPETTAVATNTTKSSTINDNKMASTQKQEEVDDRPIYLRKAMA